MSIVDTIIDIPAEHERNVFGDFDAYLKLIERTLNVTLVSRDGQLKVLGDGIRVAKAKSVFETLLELSKRGTQIQEQNVSYALSLCFEDKENSLLSIDEDLICHTIQGKPIKPKTLGQKKYVDLIREKMIVFGIGPAGTGKTYLAMAMGIKA
ncbi:MAG: PhoH family protein, partial [Acetivibrio ethanolgignens]